MARSVEAWAGKTDDSAIPPRVRLRVWDREQGKCHRCARKIPVGDAWIIEHRIALINGGANAEPNLCLSCSWCKPLKDAEDVAEKAATYRVRSKHVLPAKKSNWQSRGFPKRPPQHTATKPLTRKAT
jgi:5-methylcytosine-specific restriction protein A